MKNIKKFENFKSEKIIKNEIDKNKDKSKDKIMKIYKLTHELIDEFTSINNTFLRKDYTSIPRKYPYLLTLNSIQYTSKAFSNLIKFREYLNALLYEFNNSDTESELYKKYINSITENLDINVEDTEEDNYPYVHLFIAEDIEKGLTNGWIGNENDKREWYLEVNVKDWLKLDDEDYSLIANQIREGKTKGNDPIDWELVFGSDNFDVVEEEEYTRKDIANQLEIDEDDFDDSSSLGDMADKMSDEMNQFDYTLDEVTDLFNAYVENNDVSKYFTQNISKDFEYNKEEALYNNVIKYYSVFEESFGYLEEFNTSMFKNILKDVIKKFLNNKNNNITESKKDLGLEKYKKKIKNKILKDENFMPKLSIKSTNKFYDQIDACKTIEEIDKLITKYNKENKKYIKVYNDFDKKGE